jgi:hypothetical protein
VDLIGSHSCVYDLLECDCSFPLASCIELCHLPFMAEYTLSLVKHIVYTYIDMYCISVS